MGIRKSPALPAADQETALLSIGYRCVCGERVVVYQLARGSNTALPPTRSVTCSNGHVAVFSPEQLALLDDWEDQ